MTFDVGGHARQGWAATGYPCRASRALSVLADLDASSCRTCSPAVDNCAAFVAQDTPLYKNLSVADMIYLTRGLNRRFDQPYARARLEELGIPPRRKAGKLSGGQEAQLALTLALARRPKLLVLDEPVAMLDPVARHDFMATVLAAASADGVSVLLSSHVLTELERVASYLILLARGQVRLAGPVDDLLATHSQVSLEELAMTYLRAHGKHETTSEGTR
jgi:ABC-2 type transport system ATP-binding protein